MRQRATAVIFRDNKVLLVRDLGRHNFSLPGGGIRKGEPTVSCAAREVREELGLNPTKVIRLRTCDFTGSTSKHKVCLIEVEGVPYIRGRELDRFVWWNMKDPLPVYEHVKHIVGAVNSLYLNLKSRR